MSARALYVEGEALHSSVCHCVCGACLGGRGAGRSHAMVGVHDYSLYAALEREFGVFETSCSWPVPSTFTLDGT